MAGRGIGGGGGGRDRFRRDYNSRFEDKNPSHFGSGRSDKHSNSSSIKSSNAPPSRHLWVGNLLHGICESDLTHHFLRFGKLESVAFQPGRSYAFLNFVREDDAVAAMEALQGFPVAGNPLRIQFAKADKSSAQSCDDNFSRNRDVQRSGLRESPFFERDSRGHYASPEHFIPDKYSMNDKNTEPSVVLWIGFPASLKVDEMILRKTFSPFGEIEKITAFPGRSYAFVRFRSEISARRAKDNLQGKLFGNPRVHISFAKSETGSSNGGNNSRNAPPSPKFMLNDRQKYSENSWLDKKFGSSTEASRKGFGTGGNNTFEQKRLRDIGYEPGFSQDKYDRQRSPLRGNNVYLNDFSQTNSYYEEPWDLPDDAHNLHGAKKIKTSMFPPDKEISETSYYGYEEDKYGLPRPRADLSQDDDFNRKFDARPFDNKRMPDFAENSNLPQGVRSNPRKESYDGFGLQSGYVPLNPVHRKRSTPEYEFKSPLNDWKWEGTIAKGGTPICRARCFPVGKVLDMMLPEFLDCTARTSLDMLSKHYYQAASAWVVFFVPESDDDMGYYNEFLHYLEEKQCAAVAKLDKNTTLFLVPPSDFSSKVLKVPGKLSISGVVLRLEPPSSKIGSLRHQDEQRDSNLLSYPMHTPYANPSESTPLTPFRGNVINSANSASFLHSAHVGGKSDPRGGSGYGYQVDGSPGFIQSGPFHQMQNDSRIFPSEASSNLDPRVQDHSSIMTRTVNYESSDYSVGGTSGALLSGNSKSFIPETQSGVPSSIPITALQMQQLAQLASSAIEHQRPSGSTSNAFSGNRANDSGVLLTSQKYAVQNNQVNFELPAEQVQQLQQSLQHTSNVPAVQIQTGALGHQELKSSAEESEADKQNRLQATLQLAAALLQQIQQGNKS